MFETPKASVPGDSTKPPLPPVITQLFCSASGSNAAGMRSTSAPRPPSTVSMPVTKPEVSGSSLSGARMLPPAAVVAWNSTPFSTSTVTGTVEEVEPQRVGRVAAGLVHDVVAPQVLEHESVVAFRR